MKADNFHGKTNVMTSVESKQQTGPSNNISLKYNKLRLLNKIKSKEKSKVKSLVRYCY